MPSTYDGPGGSVAPRVTVDYSRCTTPMACRKCMQICPQAIFLTRVAKMTKYVETDIHEPGSYRLTPAFQDKCVLCGDCLKVCPVDALTITLPAEVR